MATIMHVTSHTPVGDGWITQTRFPFPLLSNTRDSTTSWSSASATGAIPGKDVTFILPGWCQRCLWGWKRWNYIDLKVPSSVFSFKVKNSREFLLDVNIVLWKRWITTMWIEVNVFCGGEDNLCIKVWWSLMIVGKYTKDSYLITLE